MSRRFTLLLTVILPALSLASPVRLLVDTDFRTDVDDVGTLAMLHRLADLGHTELIGVVASTAGPHVVSAIDAVNTYHHRPDIPIALVRADLASGGDDPYAATLGNQADYPSDQTNPTAPDSTAFYRATLHASPDASVHLVVIGGQNALHAFMRSEAHHAGDTIPLTGLQLITQKVAALTLMGGHFNRPSYAENNIKRGITAAQNIAAHWPGPVTYVGWEVGTGVLAGAALTNPSANPTARAYQIFWGSGGVGNIGNRDCWDQTAALHAVTGLSFNGHTLFTLSEPHHITFTDSGQTRITPDPAATRRHLVKTQPDTFLGTLISDLMIGASSLPPDPPPPPPPPPTGGNSIAHYTFNELPSPSSLSPPILNHGHAGPALDLTQTGGSTGRSGLTAGGYGAPAPTGYGHAFDILASGDGTHHSASSGSPVGGGLTTATPVPQSSLQGPDGAFTYEALINLSSNLSAEQTILSHDGSSTRGFLFRISGGQLSFYTGTDTHQAPIPLTGPHAFAPHQWFHTAVTYTGAAGTTGNLRFYWTSLDATPTTTHLIGTATLAADLSGSVHNLLGVGTTTRNPYRFELAGLIDEVRLSPVAHSPETFALFSPSPSTRTDTSGDGIPDAWALAHGLDPATDNAHANPSGDGLPNLLKFALGLDPRVVATPAQRPLATFDHDLHLTLTLPRNPDATHLQFTVQVSSDLITWHSGPDHTTVLESTPDRLVARDRVTMLDSPRRFMRLGLHVPQP